MGRYRYEWVGKTIHKLIQKENIRNSTILIIFTLSTKIDNGYIEVTNKEIAEYIKEEYNKNIAYSTIINSLQNLEDMEILEKIQRGNRIQPTKYKIIN